MLTYRQTDELEVISYSDSNFASCVDSHKSTSRYIFMFAGGAISWRSAKQTLTKGMSPFRFKDHVNYDLY